MKKQITLNANWTTIIEIEYTYEKKEVDKISYADGYNIVVGKEAKIIDIATVRVNGQEKTEGKIIDMGGYVNIGNIDFKTPSFVKALFELKEEVQSNVEKLDCEIKAEKEEEIKKANSMKAEERYENLVKNGLCRKCNTFCNGDCQTK